MKIKIRDRELKNSLILYIRKKHHLYPQFNHLYPKFAQIKKMFIIKIVVKSAIKNL